MNSGKCPYCKKTISKVYVEAITIEQAPLSQGAAYKGVTYLCPGCRAVLSVSMDQISLKQDTISGVVDRLRKG